MFFPPLSLSSLRIACRRLLAATVLLTVAATGAWAAEQAPADAGKPTVVVTIPPWR